jgi:hypothetical protein
MGAEGHELQRAFLEPASWRVVILATYGSAAPLHVSGPWDSGRVLREALPSAWQAAIRADRRRAYFSCLLPDRQGMSLRWSP